MDLLLIGGYILGYALGFCLGFGICYVWVHWVEFP